MNKLTKEVITSNVIHYWYILVIVISILISLYGWNGKLNSDAKYKDLYNKVQITEDIKVIEDRLVDMKSREAGYLEINKQQKYLNDTLITLDKQRKELEKQKKEGIKKDVEKFNIDQLNSEFSSVGITGTVISR